MKTLGEHLKDRRQSNGFKQTEVGKYLKMSPTIISHWESNQRVPTLQNLIKLADLYKVSLDYLVGREEENRTRKNKTNITLDTHAKMIAENARRIKTHANIIAECARRIKTLELRMGELAQKIL